MYYEVYLDFYFLESFLTDVALLILVKTVMREKWKAKRIAGTAVLESMWSCIELLLPFRGSFTATFFWIVSVLLLVRGGLGKRTAKEVLYGALLLGISSFCFGGALYVAETFRYFCGNGGISDPVDAFVSVYGNRPKQTADLRGQSLAVWEK